MITFDNKTLGFMFQLWHLWVIIALLCLIIEIFTTGFAVACFSIGAVAAAVAAACGCPVVWQVVIFAVFSFLAFVFVRPFVMKTFFKPQDGRQTNADALIGRQGRVSVDIDASKGTGRVAIDGDDWKAVSEDGSKIKKGEFVTVVKVDSIILTVK